MDNASKATRSQALIDSIHELIALERDVSGAIASMTSTTIAAAADVMVPVTPVAFMPGTITGGGVMVGLGKDYYVERNPRQAQDVLQRRITDLSHQISVLTEGALVTAAPKFETKKNIRQTQPAAETKGSWNKGFFADGRDKPNPGSPTPKDERLTAKSCQQAVVGPAQSPSQIKLKDSQGQEHVMEFEDGEQAPIMEIREWLNASGEQVSADVTDLGKVLREAPKGKAAASTPATAAGAVSVAMHSPSKSADDGQSVASLESAFDRLEAQEAAAQEAAAEEQDANPAALGTQWKKGFLGGRAKHPAPRSHPGHKSSQVTFLEKSMPRSIATAVGAGGDTSQQTERVESSMPENVAGFTLEGSDSHAFDGAVVEKPVNTGTAPIMASNPPASTLGPRVSRFKARRQGLQ